MTSTIHLTKDLSQMLVAGQPVFSRYRLVKALGNGKGMVWLAHDEQLDREVALKFIAGEWLRDGVARDELLRETKTSMELAHANLVRTYDYMDEVEIAAVSMEYVEGATLSQLRIEQPSATFDAEELVQVARNCCEALDYAHRQAGVVHGDVRPANILVNARGVAKISDFGISRALQNAGAKAPGGAMGYKSPQQLRGEPESPADDIYGFGATLYELLTGRPPFHTGDLYTQIQEVNADPVDRRREKHGVEGRPIPSWWVKTIAACLAKDPAQRPATMREVAERLGVDNPISARDMTEPVNAAPEMPRPAQVKKRSFRRTVLMVAAGIAAVASVVAGVMAVLVPMNRASDAAAKRVARGDTMREPDVPTGGLIVKSNPPGAAVLIGKERKGTTPFSATGIRTGAHEVRLVLDGFEPSTSMVTVRLGEPADMGTVALQMKESRSAQIEGSIAPDTVTKVPPITPVREPTVLSVVSEPSDMRFKLYAGAAESPGAQPVVAGITPDKVWDLAPGMYRVVFVSAPWPPVTRTVNVAPSGLTELRQVFQAGTITITSEPSGAAVMINGKEVGNAPYEKQLPLGLYQVTANYQGRLARTRSVDIGDKDTETVRFDFGTGGSTTTAATTNKGSSSGSSSSKPKSSRRKPVPKESYVTKVGRSISDFFSGDSKKRR
jgi:hypothetical protein